MNFTFITHGISRMFAYGNTNQIKYVIQFITWYIITLLFAEGVSRIVLTEVLSNANLRWYLFISKALVISCCFGCEARDSFWT